MEYFYREMRKQTGYLMQGQQPFGEQWNYDSANRKAWAGNPPLPAPLHFEHDQIDLDVLELVEREFPVTLAALTTSAGAPHVAMLCLHWSISLPTVCHILAIIRCHGSRLRHAVSQPALTLSELWSATT
jgi:hypothetical protein